VDPCCEAGPGPVEKECPSCGHAGIEVGRITLKALLCSGALARLGSGPYRLCPARDCPIVYFGQGEAFRRHEVLVPVFQKEAEGARTVCYCFEISEDRIAREVETTGASASCERIRALVQAGCCACEVRNPQGTCCLGHVTALVRSPGAAANRSLAGSAR